MSDVPHHPADPVRWHAAMTLLFAVLAAIRITVPDDTVFDEVHYLPAARELLGFTVALNLEHPPLGKQLIALGMMLFGDGPLGWRIMSLLFGVLAYFSAMRAMWFASQSRAASVLAGVFLLTGFPLLVQSRIAILDIFMIGFTMLGLWQCAAALRENETARWRLAIGGAALGAAMAAKWNAVPVAMLPGLAFLVARTWQAKWHFLTTNRGWPIGGMSLWEAGIWLGMLPLATYALSFWPFPFFDLVPGGPYDAMSIHAHMLDLLQRPVGPHPYGSQWWEWVLNLKGIWYLYEEVEGSWRGIFLLGNPLSSLAALPALAWCGWAALKQGRRDAGAMLLLYLASLLLWVIAPKPVQFYYHYILPHCFAMGALALTVERLWQRGERLVSYAVTGGSIALFVYFYPVLTAAALDGQMAFLRWTWLESWR